MKPTSDVKTSRPGAAMTASTSKNGSMNRLLDPPTDPSAIESVVALLVNDLKRRNRNFVRDLRAAAHGAIAQRCVRYLWCKLLIYAASEATNTEPPAKLLSELTKLPAAQLGSHLGKILDGVGQSELGDILGGLDPASVSRISTILQTNSIDPLECPSLARTFGYIVDLNRGWEDFDCLPDSEDLRLAAWAAAVRFADKELAALFSQHVNQALDDVGPSTEDLRVIARLLSASSSWTPSNPGFEAWRKWGRPFLVARSVIGIRRGP